MIISDNETKLDMLNNYSIASTIVTLIKENEDLPVSIGVHGDWGAGKSSILEMIESDFSKEEQHLCIKFNGWKHQGFEDAKIALIESIVSALVSEKDLASKASDKVKKIWKSVNWMKTAKITGSVAVSVAAGIPPVDLLQEGLSKMKETITDQGQRNAAIENIISQIAPSNQSMTKEFNEFSKTFHELLEASKFEKIIVLIDDLDRCLPNVIIETLEAVRLFMFEKSTVFVVAADESMVEYAVKKHFPIYGESYSSHEFARKYLEKLIQIPFRIPILGELEAKNYIMLLLISSKIKDEELFNKLILETLEKNKRPWENDLLNSSELSRVLGDSFAEVQEQVQIGYAISSPLAKGTVGNPRQMKRFINTLLLRYEIAKSRGIESDIDLRILAKLMLAERFFPEVYKNIGSSLNSKGISELLLSFEAELNPIILETEEMETRSQAELDKLEFDEKFNEAFKSWMSISPDIIKEDLRPYFFISREKNNWEAPLLDEMDNIKSLLPILRNGNSMAIAGIKDKFAVLTVEERNSLFSILSEDFRGLGSYESKPSGLLGLQELTKQFDDLQQKMLELLIYLPVDGIGTWAVSGWEGIFRGDSLLKYNSFVERVATDGQTLAKSVANTYLKRLGGES